MDKLTCDKKAGFVLGLMRKEGKRQWNIGYTRQKYDWRIESIFTRKIEIFSLLDFGVLFCLPPKVLFAIRDN